MRRHLVISRRARLIRARILFELKLFVHFIRMIRLDICANEIVKKNAKKTCLAHCLILIWNNTKISVVSKHLINMSKSHIDSVAKLFRIFKYFTTFCWHSSLNLRYCKWTNMRIVKYIKILTTTQYHSKKKPHQIDCNYIQMMRFPVIYVHLIFRTRSKYLPFLLIISSNNFSSQCVSITGWLTVIWHKLFGFVIVDWSLPIQSQTLFIEESAPVF